MCALRISLYLITILTAFVQASIEVCDNKTAIPLRMSHSFPLVPLYTRRRPQREDWRTAALAGYNTHMGPYFFQITDL